VATGKKNRNNAAGERIRKIRIEEFGMTMVDLAKAADVSAQTIRKAETGQKINEISRARIAKALKRTAADLFPE
jgi:DNA-binding XRE family transcriptional regulator